MIEEHDRVSTEFVGIRGDRYTIISRISRGSRDTTVYRARKGTGLDAGQLVAVKVVEHSKSDDTAAWYEHGRLIEREWEISQGMQQLKHDYLLLIEDHATDGDVEYYVMPLAEATLKEKVGTHNDTEILDVMRDLAHGLAELAAASVVHRDIKPSNVLFLDGRWRLADFGISTDEKRENTATWAGTGTRDYQAPEVFTGARENLLSDLYSLGCVAYELCTGKPPFAGTPDIQGAHLSKVPAPIPDIDPQLEQLIHLLLNKRAAARPQSAQEVLWLVQRRSKSSPQRQRFRKLAASYAREIGDQSAAEAQRVRRRRLADEAVVRLESLLEQVAKEIESTPMHVDFSKDETTTSWFIRLHGHRLSIRLMGDDEHADDLVCMGVLKVLTEGEHSGQYSTANVVCEEQGERFQWSLVRFVPNALAVTSRRIGLENHPVGLQGTEFWAAWTGRKDSVPPAVMQRSDLTVDVLLDAFLAEVESP